MKGQTLYAARSRMGEELAAESPVDADLVIPVPDTGNSAAIGYAAAQRHPLRRGPHQEPIHRPHLHRPRRPGAQAGHPHEVQPPELGHPGQAPGGGGRLHRAGQHHPCSGARAVRGGGAEVHLRISSPPIVFPCFYGIDMADQDEFIAFGKSVDEISRGAGGDLGGLSLPGGPDAGHQAATRTTASAPPASAGTIPARCRRSLRSPSSATRRTPAPRWIGEVRAGGGPSVAGCRGRARQATRTGATVRRPPPRWS